MKIIENILWWIDEHLPIFGALIATLGVIACVYLVQEIRVRESTEYRVHCVTSNGRPEVLYDGVAQVPSRHPNVRLIDRATGRQVILVNATCRISEKDPE